MKYVDEYRDPAAARRLLEHLRAVVTRRWVVMEVCGGQTHAIVRSGIDRLLPELIELVMQISDRTEILAARGSTTIEDRLALSELAARLRAAGEGLRTDLDTAYVEQERFSRHEGLETATAPRLASASERLETYLRATLGAADLSVAPADLRVESSDATSATAGQWQVMSTLQTKLPDAIVKLREHRLVSMRHTTVPPLSIYGVLVTRKVGPFNLRREFAAPGGSSIR